jgi:hypothetical protein
MMRVLQCLKDSEEMLSGNQISQRTGMTISEVEDAIALAFALGFVE